MRENFNPLNFAYVVKPSTMQLSKYNRIVQTKQNIKDKKYKPLARDTTAKKQI